MFHKVMDVKPLPEHQLLVTFENGEYRKYDVKPLVMKWEAFKTFDGITGLFEQVKVDHCGYGVSWNDDLDLSGEELYYNGINV